MSQKPKGIAARAGRWSAQHRKIAIFGWLAFVIVAFMVGNSLGTKKVEQTLPGESGRAQKIQEDNFPRAKKTASEETILIQSKTLKVSDPEYKAVVRTSRGRSAPRRTYARSSRPTPRATRTT